MRKVKNGQRLNISPSKIQHLVKIESFRLVKIESFRLVKIESFRLEQWGMVFQLKIVAPAKEAWFGIR